MIEEKHRGHEQMHAEMILILFGAMLLAQVVLVVWKLRHKKSYHVSVADRVAVLFVMLMLLGSYFIWHVGDSPIHFIQGRVLEDDLCVDCFLYRHLVCHI